MNFDQLTNDQLSAVLVAADNALYACGCAIAKADEGEPLPYEPELVEVLMSQWGQASPLAVEKAVELVEELGGELTDEYIDAIAQVISGEINEQFTTKVSDDVVDLFAAAYKFAKSGVLENAGLTVSFNQIDDEAIAWLQEHHMYWVGNYYDRILSDKLREHVKDGVAEGLGRADIGSSLKTFFDDYPGISSKPEVYWRGLAANGMNRSRNFGLISGYEDVGVTEFQVVAVMDERTSAVCRNLNGKRFSLESAKSQRDQLMQAQSPESVKQIAPWPSAASVKDQSAAMLSAMGISMPPYHFHCRTTIVAA